MAKAGTKQDMVKDLIRGLILGKDDKDVAIQGVGLIRLAAQALVGQAQHSVMLFSHKLDASLYNNEAFTEALTAVGLSHPNSQVRLLLQDSSDAVRVDHRVITAAQRFSSHIKVHRVSKDFIDVKQEFLIADDVGLLLLKDHDVYDATLNCSARRQSSQLQGLFTEAWRLSVPDKAFRRLMI